MALHYEQLDGTVSEIKADFSLENLNEITVFFGRNGCGKSLLLRTLSSKDKHAYHPIPSQRSGDISYDQAAVGRNSSEASEIFNKRRTNISRFFLDESIARLQAVLSKNGAKNQHVINPRELENFLNELLSTFSVEITGDSIPLVLKRGASGDKVAGVHLLSSGESQVLGLALDLLTRCCMWELDAQEKRVLLIDEPDTHLHPDLQRAMAKFFIKLLEKYKAQIIVATHSTTFLSALGHYGNEKVSLIYLDGLPITAKAVPFNMRLQQLTTCLGGHALMGPLFSAPLLLVEGDDEYRIWSEVPRHNKLAIAVVPCGGKDQVKQYQKILNQLFGCILDPETSNSGIALLDGDVTIPDKNTHPQDKITFCKLKCAESENLFLTDEVLSALGTDWEKAKKKILSAAEEKQYGEKSNLLQECVSRNRKEDRFKDVIEQLSKILDPSNIAWAHRVGKCIGQGKPTGQLAEFLGDALVNQLWR